MFFDIVERWSSGNTNASHFNLGANDFLGQQEPQNSHSSAYYWKDGSNGFGSTAVFRLLGMGAKKWGRKRCRCKMMSKKRRRRTMGWGEDEPKCDGERSSKRV
jgi:hypothetical protein